MEYTSKFSLQWIIPLVRTIPVCAPYPCVHGCVGRHRPEVGPGDGDREPGVDPIKDANDTGEAVVGGVVEVDAAVAATDTVMETWRIEWK